jgi:hypothetical protein
MTGKHGVGQVVEASLAGRATIPLASGLGRIVAVLDDVFAVTMRALHAIRPDQVAHHFRALAIINYSLNRNRHP